jgi:transmembrane sensor
VDKRQSRLLLRAFGGEASPAEQRELEAWLRADPANAREADALRAVWNAAGTVVDRADESNAWKRVTALTAIHGGAPVRSITSAPSARRRAGWAVPALRAAAMVIFALGLGTLSPPGRRLIDDHVLNRTVSTGKGERLSLILEDGTRVMLGVDSRLRVPRHFGAHARDVRLDGAAYFEVAHDHSRPFTVYSADAVTRVLGTRFTVRDYAGAEPARVAVTEGRVAVRPSRAAGGMPTSGTILIRGQAAEVDPAAQRVVRENTNRVRDLAWTQGTLAFDNAPVSEVIAEISRWYEVDLRVGNQALASRHLTIAFDREPLDTILQEIAAVLNAHVERRGRVIYLTPSTPVRHEVPIADVRHGSL